MSYDASFVKQLQMLTTLLITQVIKIFLENDNHLRSFQAYMQPLIVIRNLQTFAVVTILPSFWKCFMTYFTYVVESVFRLGLL